MRGAEACHVARQQPAAQALGLQHAAAEAASKVQQEQARDKSLCFGRPVLAAVPSACGAFVAVCLADDARSGDAACSVQIWRMGTGARMGQHPAWAGTARALLLADRPAGLQLQHSLCLGACGCGAVHPFSVNPDACGNPSLVCCAACTDMCINVARTHARMFVCVIAKSGPKSACASAGALALCWFWQGC